jgi:hypothetical protein
VAVFRRLLILLLALAWTLGPAHCLAARSTGHGMLICTAFGMATVPWPDAPAKAGHGGGACPVCLGLGVALPAAPVLPAPTVVWQVVATSPTPPAPPALFAIHRGEPRAPPAP